MFTYVPFADFRSSSSQFVPLRVMRACLRETAGCVSTIEHVRSRPTITSPLTAVLTDGYVLEADVPIPLDELIHPRVEPEIVFVMGPDGTPERYTQNNNFLRRIR